LKSRDSYEMKQERKFLGLKQICLEARFKSVTRRLLAKREREVIPDQWTRNREIATADSGLVESRHS